MRRWLPYAGITRIRFEGFSRGSSQCATAHPQPVLTIRLPPRTVKNHGAVRSQPLFYRVVRFWNNQVLENTDEVLAEIEKLLGADSSES
jgi:hypothetical protein